ncbi:MAG: hypothetical protein E6365_05310 [Klebsiella aerogenes]|nr:hypothetical protein [Klebsiella aerogenes]
MTKSTITREWLQQTIAELESVRDEIPFGIDTNSELELAAFKLALAAMDSEPVILYRERNPYNGLTTGWQELTENEFSFLKENAGENAEFVTLYRHAQPAPVVPDDVRQALCKMDDEIIAELDAEESARRAVMLNGEMKTIEPTPTAALDDLLSMAASAIEDLLEHTDPNTSYYSGVWADVPGKLRAAMLQADPVTTANKLGNSPVIGIDPASGPDRTVEVIYVAPPGYVMVPKEPTEGMKDAYYKSSVAPISRLSICGYRAMLAAAPQEVKNV